MEIIEKALYVCKKQATTLYRRMVLKKPVCGQGRTSLNITMVILKFLIRGPMERNENLRKR